MELGFDARLAALSCMERVVLDVNCLTTGLCNTALELEGLTDMSELWPYQGKKKGQEEVIGTTVNILLLI